MFGYTPIILRHARFEQYKESVNTCDLPFENIYDEHWEIFCDVFIYGKHHHMNENNYEQALEYYIMGKDFSNIQLLNDLVTLDNCVNCLPDNKLSICCHIIILSKNNDCIDKLLSKSQPCTKGQVLIKIEYFKYFSSVYSF